MFGFFKKKEPAKQRSYSAGSINRLTADWSTSASTPNSDVYADLNKLRSRSRGLVQNNGYAKKYISLAVSNIVGKNGIQLQCMFKDDNGTYDTRANDIVEEAFKKWSKKCDVTGKMTFVEFQARLIETVAQDGEAIVRIIRNFDNDFGLALQMIEADQLDINLNDDDKRIVMGVEMDAYGKPIAFHITKGYPSSAAYRNEVIRIPAEDIIHLYRPLRVGQVRGVTWMHAGMSSLNMLDKYQESELVAARVGAAKMGFYTTPPGNEYTTGAMEDNDVIMETEPGTFEELPAGWDFKEFNPTHPTTAFESFSKQVLRSVASAWSISYESLSNDREGVNYSSIRQGALEERDTWRMLQTWFSDNFHERIYEEWLPLAILNGKIKLPFSKIDKFMNVIWVARGFSMVDVMKETTSNILLSKEGLKSHADIISESGKNVEDVYAAIAREKELRDKLGITTTFDAELSEILSNAGADDENM